MPSNRVLVAMSGGVDSSVAAALLVEQGYEVVGVTMKLFRSRDDHTDNALCSKESIADAAAVADRLGIEHHVLDLSHNFEREVIRHFVSEYERGYTPIPCIRCNAHMKFGDLLRFANAQNCRHIATGHYAIVEDGALFRGKDRQKEQTYFLWAIDRMVLDRLILPLGNFSKDQTRRMARQRGFGNAGKTESVEICFVPNDDYISVIEQHLPHDSPALLPGPIVNEAGEILAEHRGFSRYTIGQRRGLPGGFPEPMYVLRISPESRTVVIGTEAALFGSRLRLSETNWLAPPLRGGDRCFVSTRYRSHTVEAVVASFDDSNPGDCTLDLSQPVRAITPGQSGVIYDERERLLGGGIIQ